MSSSGDVLPSPSNSPQPAVSIPPKLHVSDRVSSETTVITLYAAMYADGDDSRAVWTRDESASTHRDSSDTSHPELSAPESSRHHGDPDTIINGISPVLLEHKLVGPSPSWRTRKPSSTTSAASEPGSCPNTPHPRRSRSRPSTSPYRSSQYSAFGGHDHAARPSPLRPRRPSSQPQLLRHPMHAPDELVELPPIPIISMRISTPPRSHRPSHSGSRSSLKPMPHSSQRETASISSSRISPAPSSVTSGPSAGEDPDAFYIRTTYAQLDIFGVKGDGYKDGVERTRARLGTSQASLLEADSAVADGTERSSDLDPQELETLASLDRYGFFDMPTHDRLVGLPRASFQKRLSRVSAGPRGAPASVVALPCVPLTPPLPKETSRIGKWTRMLVAESRDAGSNIQTWTVRPSKELKLRERTYKGIPDRWRSAAWELFVSRATQGGKEEIMKLEKVYKEELEKPSTYDVQIDLDVPRTISGHVMFRTRYGIGQRSLFHVLHAFSLHCSLCGYVQGMGPIAATLLCYAPPAHVYATLIRLHTHPHYALHDLFAPGFPGLLEAIYVQERLVERMMPDVYRSFRTHMVCTTSYATKWYITLFANTVPFQCQLRLWDVFLLEGKDLFVIVAVGIIWAYRDNIASPSANFETILSLLSSSFVPEDENMLLTWIGRALSDKKVRANMNKWRSDWRALVAKGTDSSTLLL